MSLNQFQFAEAYAEVSLRDKQFHAAMGRITGSLTKLKASLDVAARHAQRFLMIGAGALAAFVKFAADAEESTSKFNAVFKSGAEDVRAWADELAKSVGRSRQEIENTLSAFQAFFVGLGFGAGEAAEMSKKMQALSIDFASFHNLTDAEAAQRFISALSGSSEVLDMFGINIKQAALAQELLAQGSAKSVARATEQEKALARLNIIFKAMGQQGAVGDAIRTSDSMTNQFKRLLAEVKELAVELGQTFMPIAKDLVTWLVEVVNVSKEWVLENKDLIVTLTKYGAVALAATVVSSKLANSYLAIAAALKALGLASAGSGAAMGAGAFGTTFASAAGVSALAVALGALALAAGYYGTKALMAANDTDKLTEAMKRQKAEARFTAAVLREIRAEGKVKEAATSKMLGNMGRFADDAVASLDPNAQRLDEPSPGARHVTNRALNARSALLSRATDLMQQRSDAQRDLTFNTGDDPQSVANRTKLNGMITRLTTAIDGLTAEAGKIDKAIAGRLKAEDASAAAAATYNRNLGKGVMPKPFAIEDYSPKIRNVRLDTMGMAGVQGFLQQQLSQPDVQREQLGELKGIREHVADVVHGVNKINVGWQ